MPKRCRRRQSATECESLPRQTTGARRQNPALSKANPSRCADRCRRGRTLSTVNECGGDLPKAEVGVRRTISRPTRDGRTEPPASGTRPHRRVREPAMPSPAPRPHRPSGRRLPASAGAVPSASSPPKRLTYQLQSLATRCRRSPCGSSSIPPPARTAHGKRPDASCFTNTRAGPQRQRPTAATPPGRVVPPHARRTQPRAPWTCEQRRPDRSDGSR